MDNSEPRVAPGSPTAPAPRPSPSTPSAEDPAASPPVLTPEERLQALESKTAKWKAAVAAQLNDAAHKNKKLREELRTVREQTESALSALRLQLTEEFNERTALQREELAERTQQAALLREEKKVMAAAHEEELRKARVQLREVLQLEVETEYKRKEEQWEKEKTALQTRSEAKETELAQAEHECEMLKMRLSRLGTQYEELASLLQLTEGENRSPQLQASGNANEAAARDERDPARQQCAVNAALTQQIESIKAELQSKHQQTQFLLGRAKREHEAEKAQLLRELQLREEELKVAHTLLKQVQTESSGYLQSVSHAQTEKQALEQRYAAKVATLSEQLTERMRAVDEAQAMNKRLQEQLHTAQKQVATLEEESTMREEAFHSLMLSEDNKRLVMELQKAVQTARDDAEEWKMQYYTTMCSLSGAKSETEERVGDASTLPEGGGGDGVPSSSATAASKMSEGRNANSSHTVLAAAVGNPQAWYEQLAAKESSLEAQAAELEHKAHLLEAAEAKLNDMRRYMANQANLLLRQQSSGRRESDNGSSIVFREGEGAGDEDPDRDMLDASPIIRTAASLLPFSLHRPLRTLEGHRRRLNLPGSFRFMSCCFSGNGTSGAPLRLRRTSFLLVLMVLLFAGMLIIMRAV
ncbi:hypothetical protein ABL78_7511 [Leptomonas seymouri]|uniref:Uncharacterized protein n=1 Tax=Leptomonas seymouri TaxID=5684 RepID=A0A0N1IHW2_LEPSE|nr:hypothetical protein ABL78_7511 [Leptomonas seymouri]|eukprot:KPI83455.1 hypothetical protein ABL78_7511 [Leptomonas seymouri]